MTNLMGGKVALACLALLGLGLGPSMPIDLSVLLRFKTQGVKKSRAPWLAPQRAKFAVLVCGTSGRQDQVEFLKLDQETRCTEAIRDEFWHAIHAPKRRKR